MISAILSIFFIFTATLLLPLNSPREVQLNQEFEIKVGETVSIGDTGVIISFTSVAEDSRCPEGVQCIWAGNGKVVLEVCKGRKPAATIALNTTVDPKQNVYQGYDFKLVGLNPYPKKDVNIKKDEYVAKLVVSRK